MQREQKKRTNGAGETVAIQLIEQEEGREFFSVKAKKTLNRKRQ